MSDLFKGVKFCHTSRTADLLIKEAARVFQSSEISCVSQVLDIHLWAISRTPS